MPALVPVVDTLESVPEAARSFYEQKDGKYHLSLDGAPVGFVPAAQLAEANGKVVTFRDTNVALLKEIEPLRGLKTQFEGIDPAAAKDAISKVAELGKKGVTGEADLKTLIDAAVLPLRTQLETQAAATATERKRADDAALRANIGEKFLKAGGKAKALDYVIGQAQGVFTVEQGVVKAMPNKFSTEKPGDPLGIDEWITSLAKDNDFAFEGSGGGGAAGGSKSVPGAVSLKPGQTVLTNPTAAQLGEHSAAILKGTVKVQYTNT